MPVPEDAVSSAVAVPMVCRTLHCVNYSGVGLSFSDIGLTYGGIGLSVNAKMMLRCGHRSSILGETKRAVVTKYLPAQLKKLCRAERKNTKHKVIPTRGKYKMHNAIDPEIPVISSFSIPRSFKNTKYEIQMLQLPPTLTLSQSYLS